MQKPELPEYYVALFKATERAIQAIDLNAAFMARFFLIRGQQLSEELYLEEAAEKSAQDED